MRPTTIPPPPLMPAKRGLPTIEDAERPTLIRLPISHYCKKVEWAMSRGGVPYDSIDVWFRELVDFTHVNPDNTVPVLEVDGRLLCGSDRIMAWLDQQRPDAGLYPSKEVRTWETWTDDLLGPLARRDAYRTLYHRPWRYGRNPLVWAGGAALHGTILNILKAYKVRRFDGQDAADRPMVIDKVATQLRASGTGYLFTDQPTAADFATAALLNAVLPVRQWEWSSHRDARLLRAYVRAVRPRRMWRRRRRRASKADHARWGAMPKDAAGQDRGLTR